MRLCTGKPNALGTLIRRLRASVSCSLGETSDDLRPSRPDPISDVEDHPGVPAGADLDHLERVVGDGLDEHPHLVALRVEATAAQARTKRPLARPLRDLDLDIAGSQPSASKR